MKKLLSATAILLASASLAGAEGVLQLYNWGNYTSPELLEKFEAETGIKVTVTDYDSNVVALAKVVAGEASQEQRLNDIADGVADVLIGWTPGNGVQPLSWISSSDGPAEQSVQTVDLVFKTQVSYQYSAAAAA